MFNAIFAAVPYSGLAVNHLFFQTRSEAYAHLRKMHRLSRTVTDWPGTTEIDIGDKNKLPEKLQAREQPSTRIPLKELAFEGAFPSVSG